MGDSTIASMFDAELNVQEPVMTTVVDETTIVTNSDESTESSEPLTAVDAYSTMVDTMSYNDAVNELNLDAEKVQVLIGKTDEVYKIADQAERELSTDGDITNETALRLNQAYNELTDMLDLPNVGKLTSESALNYKKEVYKLTIEGALSSTGEFIKALKDKILNLLMSLWEKLKEWATKLGSMLNKQEMVAKDLSKEIANEYTDFKIDKWEKFIPFADILGNFTILKSFDVTDIVEFVEFNNNGFRSKELLELFVKCTDKMDMSAFKRLEGIPVDYDLKDYFKDYRDVKTVPVDVSGKTATVILSYVVDDKGNKETKLEKKVFPLAIDPAFKSSLKIKGLLSRKDMITILEKISDATKKNRESINTAFKQIDAIKKIGNNINDTYSKLYTMELMKSVSILTNTISISTRVGLFSNSFIIGTIGKMTKLYKKQNKTKK